MLRCDLAVETLPVECAKLEILLASCDGYTHLALWVEVLPCRGVADRLDYLKGGSKNGSA
jgi:hypothetical protein